MVAEVGRRPLVDYPPAAHDDDAVADRKGLAHVLLHQQYRHAPLGPQPRDRLDQVLEQLRRQPDARLVQQQHLRSGQQRTRNADHLLLPAAQRARHAPGELLDPRQQFQHVVDPRRALALRHARGPQRQAEYLQHRQVREHPAPFRHQRHAGRAQRRRAVLRQLLPEHADLAGRRPMQPEQHPQQRGLAGAVMADQAQPLARRQRQGDILQHLPPAIARGQAGRLDRRGRRRLRICAERRTLRICAGHAAASWLRSPK